MRTLTIIPLILGLIAFFATLIANANDKYTEAMKQNIQSIYTASSSEEFQSLVNAFERIGESEKNKWEPFYYAGYGYLMMAIREKEVSKKDALLDLSLKAIDKGKNINPSESELTALEGFNHMIRVSVDPASRGQMYSGLSIQALNKALAMNPDNPRAIALLAQMQFGTAKFFGSSTAEACATNNKALEKFESFKSVNPVAPKWGKQMAEGFKNQCN